VAVADVVDVVAVEVHVAAAGQVLDPDPLRAPDRREAGRGERLVEEVAGVLVQERASRGVEVAPRPGRPLRRAIAVAVGGRGLRPRGALGGHRHTVHCGARAEQRRVLTLVSAPW
jgi:hypothetical protein